MGRSLSLALWVSCTTLACAHRPAGEQARSDLAAGRMVPLAGGWFRLHHGTGPLGDVPSYVSVDPFLLDVTEVTVGAYAECVRAGRCEPAAGTVRWEAIGRDERAHWSRYCNPDAPERRDHPVNCVDWDQARAYCAFAGKRLPTEVEWEWAARNGGAGTTFPWGDAAPADEPCWSGARSDAGGGAREGTCPAGSHAADVTRAGVKDLAGNVSEWTASETVVGHDSRGRGGAVVKVFRGGAWPDADPAQVSIAGRAADLRSRRDIRVGFRCASEP